MQVYLPTLVHAPAGDAPDRDEPDVDGPDAPPPGHGELRLVVEEEEDALVQHSLRSLLLTYNHDILLASNGFEALDCYAKHLAILRLVVLDIMMPDIDGITLIQRLKVMQPSVKIIANSGLPTYQATAIVAGASDFLRQPYDLSDLLKTIAILLHQT